MCDDENTSSPSCFAALICQHSLEISRGLGPAAALWEDGFDGFGVVNAVGWCSCLADLALLWKMFYAKQELLCFGKQLGQRS